MPTRRVVIMGAAGRDFHNFNVLYRGRKDVHVVAFTAAQIPNIAGRVYPRSLAGPGYPRGIPILPEEQLAELVRRERVDDVVLSYSDLPHLEVMHKASIALAAGAAFVLPGPRETMLRSSRPVVSVCAVRTGAGKSPVSRFVAQYLRRRGKRVAIVRHPMPYGDLEAQAVQRFTKLEDLTAARCTIEEREEYEPHLREGSTVFAGVDYERILRRAEKEADIILWDGGNNDLPFFAPDLHLVVVDPHRPGDELAYHPGEANLRMADVLIVSKTNTARPRDIATVERNARAANPRAPILRGALVFRAPRTEPLRGRKALAIEDGPTVTHGGMSYGAASLLAQARGARLVDPRRSAVGSLVEVYRRFPHLGRILPAMGYGPRQVHDLERTIQGSEAEVVVDASPVDLRRLIRIRQPVITVRYEYQDPGRLLERTLARFLRKSD
jgi:predicted GTPase